LVIDGGARLVDAQPNVQAQRGCAAVSRSVRWSAGLGKRTFKVGAGKTALTMPAWLSLIFELTWLLLVD